MGRKVCSFLKKRTKKLLIQRKRTDAGHGQRGGMAENQKSFGSFLQKRTRFLSVLGHASCIA
jgi:hypothetical protein